MDYVKRGLVLSLAMMPLSCSIQPLRSLETHPSASIKDSLIIRPPSLGQSWIYKKFNYFNSALLETITEKITLIGPNIHINRQTEKGITLDPEIHKQWGVLKQDPFWDFTQMYSSPVVLFNDKTSDFYNQSINSSYLIPGFSYAYWISVYYESPQWETIFTSDKKYEALKISRIIRLNHPDHTRTSTMRRDTYWLVPEIGRWCVRETQGTYTSGRRGWFNEDHFRYELQAWT